MGIFGVIGIIGIIAIIVLIVSLPLYDMGEDWAEWTGLVSGFVFLICLMCGVIMEDKQPKSIETKHPPQIDTIITIKNHVPDTTYVYTFIEKED